MAPGTDPIFTNHAAKRILQRKLNAPAIFAKCRDAIAAGIGATHSARITYGKVVLVIHQCRVVTVYVVRKSGHRRNQHGKRKRAMKRERDAAT